MLGIKKYFNNRAKKREENKLFEGKVKELISAIREGSAEKTATLFADVKVSPLYTEGTHGELLKEVIATDNTAVFSVLLDLNNKPNFWFYLETSSLPGAPPVKCKEHILHAAINAGSKKIALLLAHNEKVSIHEPGYAEMSYPGHTETIENKSCLELAEEKGLYEVASVLAARTAREYEAQAQQAKSKIEQYNRPNF